MSRQIGHFRFSSATEHVAVDGARAQSSPACAQIDEAYAESQSAARSHLRRTLRAPTTLGTLIVCLSTAVTALLSLSPYYGSTDIPKTLNQACSAFKGTPRYAICVHEKLGSDNRIVSLHWNAWGSWFSWPAIVLFLVVAAVVGFKAVFSKSKKVVLSRQIKLALILADLLFLVSVFHIPHDNAGRAWGLWLSLVCVIGINIGILLATTEFGEWIAEHWPKQPHTATEPTQQPYTPHQADYRPTPQAMPPGHRQPSWPPQAGQQQFPQPFPPGQQQVPPSDQR